MENLALIESFSEFKDDKFIDRVTLMSILEDVFRNTLKRKFGEDNFSYTKRLKKSTTSNIKLSENDKLLIAFFDKFTDTEIETAYTLLDLSGQKISPSDLYTGLLLLNLSLINH